MKLKYKKDNRDKLWAKFELEIKNRANQKDKKFVLSGRWKKFLKRKDGFKIYAVDGTWVRNNLSVFFIHAGHGYIHEFIPKNEIWIATHHFHESPWCKCICKISKKNQKISKKYVESTIIHEITEFKKMRKGKIYWKAHQIALQKESELGLIKNPYTDL